MRLFKWVHRISLQVQYDQSNCCGQMVLKSRCDLVGRNGPCRHSRTHCKRKSTGSLHTKRIWTNQTINLMFETESSIFCVFIFRYTVLLMAHFPLSFPLYVCVCVYLVHLTGPTDYLSSISPILSHLVLHLRNIWRIKSWMYGFRSYFGLNFNGKMIEFGFFLNRLTSVRCYNDYTLKTRLSKTWPSKWARDCSAELLWFQDSSTHKNNNDDRCISVITTTTARTWLPLFLSIIVVRYGSVWITAQFRIKLEWIALLLATTTIYSLTNFFPARIFSTHFQ